MTLTNHYCEANSECDRIGARKGTDEHTREGKETQCVKLGAIEVTAIQARANSQ